MNIREAEQPLSASKLIGHLIMGTEGRPIRHANLPEIIDVQGIIHQRIQEVWSISDEDPQRREHAIVALRSRYGFK